jgi:hypothetical protein
MITLALLNVGSPMETAFTETTIDSPVCYPTLEQLLIDEVAIQSCGNDIGFDN